MEKTGTRQILHTHSRLKYVLILEGTIVGIIAGIVSVIYRWLLSNAETFAFNVSTFVNHHVQYIPFLFIGLIIIGIIVSICNKWEPYISGSGIPQIEGEVANQINQNWWKVLTAKIVGGTLCIVGGLSLGREGPSIQLGGMCGKGFAKLFKRIRVEERYLITCGAAAGLSAAFNAPLAGVLFCLEEIHKNFSMSVVVSCMCASVAGDFISQYVFGFKPALDITVSTPLPSSLYVHVIVIGLLCGVCGAIYNFGTLKTQDLYKKIPFLKKHQYVIIPFIISGILMLVCPRVLCGGHAMFEFINEYPTLKVLLLLLLLKYLFTIVCFGSGAPGGIFFPLLILGSYIGAAYGTFAVAHLGLDSTFIYNMIIIAMAGFFTGIVRAPITGIVLIAEMTGTLTHLLPLTIASVIAYVVAHFLKSKPIYESLLDRLLKGNGNEMEKPSEHKRLIESVVQVGSIVEEAYVGTIKWPKGALLVSIRRGNEEILPKLNSTILAGDTLVVLCNEPGATLSEGEIEELCQRRSS